LAVTVIATNVVDNGLTAVLLTRWNRSGEQGR
jgi:hypothetical protein